MRRTLRMGNTISEIRGGSQSDHFRLLQILECDADAFACHVTSALHLDKKMESVASEIVKVVDSSPEDRTHITYLAAVAVLFRLLSAGAPSEVAVSDTSHPHPAVRALIVGCCALARSLSRMEATESTAEALLDRMLTRSIRNIENVWAEFCLPGQVSQTPDVWAAGVRAGAHTLFGTYESERARLEQFAHLRRSWHDWQWPV